MNFYAALWDVFRSQPARALAALYWHITGRKVRARNRLRMALQQGPDAYRHFIDLHEDHAALAGTAEQSMAGWHRRPLFSILLHQREGFDQAALDRLLDALRAQIYPAWELVVVPASGVPRLYPQAGADQVRIVETPAGDGGEALKIAASRAEGDLLLPLSPQVVLSPDALFRYAEALQAKPAADLLYADHDELDELGVRQRPWLKPRWNAELALSQDYLSQAFVVAASAAQAAVDRPLTGDHEAAYALALAVAGREDAVVRHVPHVLAHLPSSGGTTAESERIAIVEAQLRGTGATAMPGMHGTVRVDWPLTDPFPMVSIIIPTRDRIGLLKACLSSLEEHTSYRPYELIIVDNGSVQADSLAYLGALANRDGITVIRDDRPYNFSQLNNLAAKSAAGTYLCLLNNDTEIIEGDWLTAMMRHAVRPRIGAVGARLLYDDGSIQHAGVTVGLGDAAGHAHRFARRDAIGYFARTHAAHYVTAVTAACLVVEKRKFLAVDGLDEESLAVAFNDVDLCLKLGRAGWSNVYAPQATLLHHESKSRGKDFSPQHVDRYRRELQVLQQRWGTRDYADPLHHVHLDRSSESYMIRL